MVQTRTPVNRFPDFVRYAVQQIKLFCPTLGKAKIADKLARAAIHIGTTTVQRILKEKPAEDQLEFEQEIHSIIDWYNEYRPHDTLDGKTPNEVHFSRSAANEQPRLEPRERWSRGSLCAKPQVDVEGDPGDPVILEIDCHKGRRHLPVIRARRAA